MKRSYVKDVKVGESVLLKGWVYKVRDLTKLVFLLLRDSSGIVQCITKDKKIIDKISKLSLESVIEVHGKVRKAYTRKNKI